jgi:acetyl-CoA synthetase
MAQSRKLTTVQAALRVLAHLLAHPEGLEAAQVARLLGKSLSTAYALLASLVAEGFAERVGTAYRASLKALSVVPSASLSESESLERLQDALEELYLRTRERTYLGLLTREGRLRLQSKGRQGQPKPPGLEGESTEALHALALGKAVLAFLDGEPPGELRAYTPNTLTEPVALQDELHRVRQMGFAVEIEEFAQGFSAVAAPIFGPEGRVVGAFGVVVPSRRFPYAFTRLVRAVREVAHTASGFSPSEVQVPQPVASSPAALEPQSPHVQDRLTPPEPLCRAANLQDYAEEYRRSQEDPEGFWRSWAERFEWFRPFERTRGEGGWFEQGQTNAAYNALDRHAGSSRRNQLALVAHSGDGQVHKLSYRELLDRVARLAGVLKGLGVGVGDRVAVYMPTGLEAALTLLACARIGAIHTTVAAGLGSSALRERLVDTQARLLVASDRMYQSGRALSLVPLVQAATEGLEIEVLWHGRGREGYALEFWELLERQRPDTPAEPLPAEHPLFILHTSGSTGKPKGVVHTHAGFMVGTTYHLRTLFDLKDGETFWTTAELSWIVGHAYGLYAPLLEGLTTVLREERPDYPDPSSFYEFLEQQAVNVLLTSPTWLRAFRRHGPEWRRRADLSNLRLVGSVGEYLAPEVWHWATEHLAWTIDNWWQTETAAPCLATPLCLPTKPGKVGFPLPGVKALILDAEGRPVPAGHKGRLALQVSFPQFMHTLWNNPTGYAEVVQSGLYFTGDIARMDEEGYITLLGRGDDVIKAGEQRIGTAEIEGAMLSHPAVVEAAAIGLPDPEGGELIKIYVVPRTPDMGAEVQAVMAQKLATHLRRQLGPLEVPVEVVFTPQLPRTKSGKILRRVLRARETGADPGDLSTLED